ncbi:MAG: NAD(P)/FAD-dependent oxidoreductase [Bacteroidota bacterium]|nr:NAD(P)/FAD-dependent oxidoreductase [Bacteroidota bacterium]
MTETIKSQICIVGAGPAGATASIMLSKMGIHHVIVDAAEFPRDKICGDGLDLNVIRVLNNIDPAIARDELAANPNFTPSQGIRFILPGLKQVDLMRKPQLHHQLHIDKPLFYTGKRSSFDNLLVRRLRTEFADVHLGTRIVKIEKDGETWKLTGNKKTGKIEIEAKFLVGADGDHSVVIQQLGERKIDRTHYAAALRQYWKGVEGTHAENLIEVYFPKSLPLSYFWIFPFQSGEANVGFGMASKYIAKKNINLRNEFKRLIETDPYLTTRFQKAVPQETVRGWGVPMSSLGRKAHGDGWLLVGDAASIVCPTSGEGVGSGMISGFTAATFLQRAVQHNCFEQKLFAHYDREIHKRLRLEERFFNLVNTLPPVAFTIGMNTLLSNRFFQNWFSEKEMQRWIDTAYNKPIVVNIN